MAAIPEGNVVTLCARISTNGPLERSVSLSIVQFTNTGSLDVTVRNSGLVSFLSGDDIGTENCVEVVTVDDDILEDNEEFQFRIIAGIGSREVISITSGPASITIIDDDSKS